jgi:hypothetical protein
MVSDVYCTISIKMGSLGAQNPVHVRSLSPARPHTFIPAQSGPAHFAAYLSIASRLARCQGPLLGSTSIIALPCARSQYQVVDFILSSTHAQHQGRDDRLTHGGVLQSREGHTSVRCHELQRRDSDWPLSSSSRFCEPIATEA